jgi:hypothetical protein
MKHRMVHALQKYVLNPPIKLLFALGIVPPGYALLETIVARPGRRAALQLAMDASPISSGLWPSIA